MSTINAKLSLNRTPQSVDSNSLVFAKNIKVLKDNTIGCDNSIEQILLLEEGEVLVGEIVGVNNKIYYLINTDVTQNDIIINKSKIIEYDEETKSTIEVKCNWTYNGGVITGYTTINNNNDIILTICEYGSDVDVPIKHINITKSSYEDEESLYTQNPNIPITNLTLLATYTKTIPNGVYQFFIRYKIRDNFYTSWFPCSKECFAGTSDVIKTIQGQLKNVNIHRDSSKSFIFSVEHLYKEEYANNYQNYQLGFILSHDDAVVARSWKSFNFDTKEIYFDYDKSSIKEVNIDEMLDSAYELFNVKNITYYKNKLYISNYKETDFNPNLSNVASAINVTLTQKELDTGVTISIGDGVLESSGNYGNIFDKWKGDNVNILFGKSEYNILTSITSNDSTINSADNDKFVLTGSAFWTFKNDPDIAIINSCKTDISTFPSTNPFSIPYVHQNSSTYNPFDIADAWLWKVNSWSDKSAWIQNNGTHPFDKINSTKGKWYYVSNTNGPKNNLGKQFMCYDTGFTDAEKTAMETYFGNLFYNYVLNEAPSTVLNGVYIIDALNNKHFIKGSQEYIDNKNDALYFGGIPVSNKVILSENELKTKAIELITDYIIGINEDGSYIALIDGNYVTFNSYQISYSNFEYKLDTSDVGNDELWMKKYTVAAIRKNNTIYCTCAINPRFISDDYIEAQYNTLLPFTDYDFYVHYVKQNGVATNGFYITTQQKSTYDNPSALSVIYPIFSNIVIPDGYVGCFISIYKSGFDVCRLFNHELSDDGYHYADCLDADTLLYNLHKDLIVLDSTGIEVNLKSDGSGDGTYLSSGTTDPISLFGNSGTVRWPKQNNEEARYNTIPNFTITITPNQENPYNCFMVGNVLNSNHLELIYNSNSDSITTLTNWLASVKVQYPTFNYTVTETQSNINVTLGTSGNIKHIGYGTGSDENSSRSNAKVNRKRADSINNYDYYWLKINSKNNTNDSDKQLIKLTPYIKKEILPITYDSFNTLNMPGHICKVYKLDRDISNNIYCSGNDVYVKSISGNNFIQLNENDSYIPLNPSKPAYILSNFNLNYVSLTEDLTPQIRSFAETSEDKKLRQIVYSVNSMTSSYILELASMYHDYVRKYYYVINNKAITDFDNTIRSSDANMDEAYKDIYRFKPEDYYMIPTNRGVIVNMFNIVNNIYIHTEQSLFKFAGGNSLSSEGQDVKLKESDIFDTGITEVFDSKYGYAGIKDKNHSLVMFNTYVFYDKQANIVYAYGGDSQIAPINGTIQKILTEYDITDINFVSDEQNDRFYMNIRIGGDNILLTYNIRLKAFVSIHDFDYDRAFNSRTNTYFIKKFYDRSYIFSIVKKYKNLSYDKLYKQSLISINDMPAIEDITKSYTLASAVDIIINDDYEHIKVLNYLNWIISSINWYNTSDNMAEENLDANYPGDYLRIYTDTCSTDIINLNPRSNDEALNNKNFYQKPRYNCGIWSFNYFKNIKNTSDIFNYNTRVTSPDNNSLIYGKYFVIRFIFKDHNFKLENININSNDYEKV